MFESDHPTPLTVWNSHSDGTPLTVWNGHSDGTPFTFWNGHSDGTLSDLQRYHRELDAPKGFYTDLYFNALLLQEKVGKVSSAVAQVWRAEQRAGNLDVALNHHRDALAKGVVQKQRCTLLVISLGKRISKPKVIFERSQRVDRLPGLSGQNGKLCRNRFASSIPIQNAAQPGAGVEDGRRRKRWRGLTEQIDGSRGFRVVRVLDSLTCWGHGAKTPNKLGNPTRQPHEIPEPNWF